MKPAPAEIYKLTRLESAPPLKLVVLMYDGALLCIGQAKAALDGGDLRTFHERCLRAQSIVSELRLALDPAHAPELVEQLEALYLFSEAQIRKAILEATSEPLESVERTMSTLLEGWSQIEVAP